MNYRTGKILLITSLLLLPAAWSPAWGEEPAFLYTHIHREGSSVTREESRVEEKTSSKTTTHSGDAWDYGVSAAFKGEKGWGLLGREGEELVPPVYSSIRYEGEGLFLVKGKKGSSYITADGKPAAPPIEEGPSFYREKGKYGISDRAGKRVTAPLYRQVLAPFSEGIALVEFSDGQKGGIDETGKVLFTADFDSAGPYRKGLAEYRRKVNRFNWGVVAGAVLGGLGGSGGSDDMLPLSYDGVKRGYMDSRGRIIVDSRADEVYPMTDWGTFVKNKGLLGFVNRQGEYIITPGRYDLSGGMLYEKEGLVTMKDRASGKMGAFRLEDGRQIMDFLYDRIAFLGENRMIYEKAGKTVLAAADGTVVREVPSGAVMLPYSEEGMAWLEKRKDIQAVDLKGQTLFTLQEGEAVRPFRHGLAPVKHRGRWGLMDEKGQWVRPPAYKDLQMM